ncbi:uncharacterized protein LOC135083378 [Ostrinia nubilalis]|uniref:uncharacterized protein LOC135083378 n=1 Tax=Ostrinia nubilalis TaxID=29057 RepID=UPI0030822056
MTDLTFSMDDLRGRTYRDLQQLAKSLGLPSNVKKIYLIQLIHAKKYSTPTEVEAIVEKVKLERKQQAQVRKRAPKKGTKKTNLQLSEISSTSNSQSPPISHTPKRPGHIIVPCSEVRHTIVKYPRQSMIRSTYIKKTYPSPVPTTSDRVLRSFSLKPKNQNSILSVFKEENPTSLNEARMEIMGEHKVYPRASAIAKCLVKKQRPQMQSRSASLVERLRGQLLPMARMNSCPLPTRRQRVLSGIYPITAKVTKDTSKVNYEYIQSVGFRRSDGSVSRINALVQKSCNEQPRNLEVTVQDLINSNVDSQQAQSLEYPNMSSVTDYSQNYQKQRTQFEMPDRSYPNQCIDDSVYYHKKIRAEQVRSQRPSVREERCKEKLPNINEVFTRFNDVQRRDLTQPIYVQVSDESERILNYPVYMARNSTNLLENLYNFKRGFLVHQPLLQVATAASTRCVYSTPVIASA